MESPLDLIESRHKRLSFIHFVHASWAPAAGSVRKVMFRNNSPRSEKRRPITIETDRTILVPGNPFWIALHTYKFTKVDGLFYYLGWTDHWTFLKWYKHVRRHCKRDRHCHAIIAKNSKSYIGLHFSEISWQHSTVRTSLFIGDYEWRGKGIMREVRKALLSDAFVRLGLNKSSSTVAIENTGSIKNALALGAKIEGRLRSGFVFSDGKRSDAVIFGLLREEWLSRENDTNC